MTRSKKKKVKKKEFVYHLKKNEPHTGSMRRRRRKTQTQATTLKVALDTDKTRAPQFPFPLFRGCGNG